MVNEKDIVTIDGTRYFVGQEHSNSGIGQNGIIRFYIPITPEGDVDNTKDVISMSDDKYNTKLVLKSAKAVASRLEKEFEKKHGMPGQTTVASLNVLRNPDFMNKIGSYLKNGGKTKKTHKRRPRKTKRRLSKK
jgi:hypothetical protein